MLFSLDTFSVIDALVRTGRTDRFERPERAGTTIKQERAFFATFFPDRE